MNGKVVSAVLALVLVLAGAASAAASPRLVASGTSVSSGSQTGVTLDLDLPEGASGMLTLSVPPGYGVRLDQPLGGSVGSVLLGSADSGGGTVELPGELTAAEPSAYADNTCAPGLHAAVWVMTLTSAAGAASVPVFVDAATAFPRARTPPTRSSCVLVSSCFVT